MAAGILLGRYRVVLVHSVVKQATLQKVGPAERTQVDQAFERARRKSDQNGSATSYLQTLFDISQRVEKVQQLSDSGSGEIVERLNRFSSDGAARGLSEK